MKKIRILLPLIVALFAFSSNSYADPKETYTLEPTKDTEKIFNEITLTVEGDNDTIDVKDKVKGNISERYHIVIDKEKKTYKVKKSKDTTIETVNALASGDKYLYVTGITECLSRRIS
jgi:hypothetical protein